MTSREIRASFLRYFERQGHRVVPSASLVPHDDPTLLFTNAGMNQFKDVFLGRETREYRRAATAQKCVRASGKHNDLDNVGPSLRHHTFFEMLGNFSFGDYFKRDAIPFAWQLLTGEWRLPADRLYVTVFRGAEGVARDTEAYDVWRQVLPAERIGELGADDNFWQMGETGPCGRCSEIYFFRGAEVPCAEQASGAACRGLECGCDRYIEIWNNVFMEFDRQPDGTLEPLPAPSIDTGMGFERMAAVLQGHLSNYDSDLFTPLLRAIGERTGTTHQGTMTPSDVSMRVIADHLRTMTFLIADGVTPSNEHRGYVLRKIMRRAMRHGRRLGTTEPFLYALTETVVAEFGDAYPELRDGRDAIVRTVRSEEARFDAVLTNGLPRLEEALERTAAGSGVLGGDDAFRLYDTHGLPLDFITDVVDDRKLAFDQTGFDRALEAQRTRARAKSTFRAATQDVEWLADDETRRALETVGDGAFHGYETTSVNAQVVALFDARHQHTRHLAAGEHGFVALTETPFYLEAGGQVSDVGAIMAPHGEARVASVARVPGWPRLHAVHVTTGELRTRDLVTAAVDAEVRDATRRNHTATHLLHAALRQVLGLHVKQAGSLVAPDRLRFDFVHVAALTADELTAIERIVNEHVLRNTAVQTEIRATQEAMAAGAMALFGEKYGDTVRVVSIPGFSLELCGGTHARATGEIGLFAIVSEGGVAAGVRRIEAITGHDAVTAFQQTRDRLARIEQLLGARGDDLVTRAAALQEETRRLARELQQARLAAALAGGDTTPGGPAAPPRDEAVEVGGVRLVARQVSGLDKEGLRALVDRHRDRIGSGVVVLASPGNGKVAIVVGVTSDLTARVPAGQLVKELAPLVGGRGGGRPDFAEAGGKDPSGITNLLATSRTIVERMLSA